MKASLSSIWGSVKARTILMVVAALAVLAGAAGAQTVNYTPTTALGTSDYGQLTQSFSNALAPILGQVLPFAIILMAIWFGPGLFHRLLKQFSH